MGGIFGPSGGSPFANDILVGGATFGHGGGASPFRDTNTASGLSALGANQGGYNLSAFGAYALAANIAGIGNSASGFQSQVSNKWGSYDDSLGFQSLSWMNGYGAPFSSISEPVPGTLRFATADTGLLAPGDSVGISGTANYDGIYSVTAISVNAWFEISAAFVISETGNWIDPARDSFNVSIGAFSGYQLAHGARNTYLGWGAGLQGFVFSETGSTKIGCLAGSLIGALDNSIVLSNGITDKMAYMPPIDTWIFSGAIFGDTKISTLGNIQAKQDKFCPYVLSQTGAVITMAGLAATFAGLTLANNGGNVQLQGAGAHGITAVSLGAGIFVSWAGGTGVDGIYSIVSIDSPTDLTIAYAYDPGYGVPTAAVSGIEIIVTSDTVPGGDLGGSGSLSQKLLVECLNTSGLTNTVKLRYGGQQVFSTGAAVTYTWTGEIGFANVAGGLSQIPDPGFYGIAAGLFVSGLTVDSTINQQYEYTVTLGGADDLIRLYPTRITIYPGL